MAVKASRGREVQRSRKEMDAFQKKMFEMHRCAAHSPLPLGVVRKRGR